MSQSEYLEIVEILQTEDKFCYLEKQGIDSVALFLYRYTNIGYQVLVHGQKIPVYEGDTKFTSTPLMAPLPTLGTDVINELPMTEQLCISAGYYLSSTQFVHLGAYIPSAQSNEKVFMWAFDVTEVEQKPNVAYTWLNINSLQHCEHVACQIGYLKLSNHIKGAS